MFGVIRNTVALQLLFAFWCCASEQRKEGQNAEELIVGGKEATPHEWPWTVQYLNDPEHRHDCGGALIGRNLVLTAAHCSFGRETHDLRVVVGEHNWQDDSDGQRRIRVKDVYYSHYSPRLNLYRSDIALVVLEEPIDCSHSRDIIHLPWVYKPGMYHTKPPLKPLSNARNATCYKVGWGRTKPGGKPSPVLKEFKGKGVVSYEECPEITPNHMYPPAKTLICTKDYPVASNCEGDSGSPVFCDTGTDPDYPWELYGVLSFGSTGRGLGAKVICDPKKNVSWYTNVLMFYDWILNTVKEAGEEESFWDSLQECGFYKAICGQKEMTPEKIDACKAKKCAVKDC